jgi:endonuclease YncB( thermonuclease family)
VRTPRAALPVALLAGLLVAAPAQADDPPLRPGETVRDRGYAAMVVDGDTLRFSHSRNRLTDSYQVVRLLGVQTPEKLPGASGCEGPQAHDVLREAIEGRPVVLTSAGDSRSSIRNRRLRTVYVKTDGSWVDASALMLRNGLGQWMPKKYEPVHNLEYRRLFDAARAEGRNMWNPEYCGAGPAATLRLVIQPDPIGDDARNLNSEYVAIVNDGASRVDLSGWVIRDGSLDWLRLPNGTGVDPGSVLTVRSGTGPDGAATVYWGRRTPVWANFTTARGTRTKFGFIGDGAYLLDPLGNVRASKVYPCLGGACTTPATDALRIATVRWDPPGDERGKPNSETIRVTNTGATTLSLFGYELRAGGFGYEFGPYDTLAAGTSLTLRLGDGRSTADVRHLGLRRAALANSGDRILLRSFDGAHLDCRAWGRMRCPAGY